MSFGDFLYTWAAVVIFRHDYERAKLIEDEKEYARINGLPEPVFEKKIPWAVWALGGLATIFIVTLFLTLIINALLP